MALLAGKLILYPRHHGELGIRQPLGRQRREEKGQHEECDFGVEEHARDAVKAGEALAEPDGRAGCDSAEER